MSDPTRDDRNIAYPYCLDDALQKLADSGELGHLTLVRSTCGRWQAAHKRVGSNGYHVDIRKDPVDALLTVLHGPGLATVAEQQPEEVKL